MIEGRYHCGGMIAVMFDVPDLMSQYCVTGLVA